VEIKYYEASLDAVAERLEATLEKLPDLLIAILFGSVLRRKFVRDVDIAVYFRYEESLKDLIELAGTLEDELGLPIDVVPLREVPPKLKLKILLEGVKLIVRDSQLYWSLTSQALAEVFDVELKYRSLRDEKALK